MRDAEAWCAAGIVGPGRPLLVTNSALPMMLGLILFLLVHGSTTYGWRGALGFFACGTRWRSRSRRRPSRRDSPSASSPTTGPVRSSLASRPRCRPGRHAWRCLPGRNGTSTARRHPFSGSLTSDLLASCFLSPGHFSEEGWQLLGQCVSRSEENKLNAGRRASLAPSFGSLWTRSLA